MMMTVLVRLMTIGMTTTTACGETHGSDANNKEDSDNESDRSGDDGIHIDGNDDDDDEDNGR